MIRLEKPSPGAFDGVSGVCTCGPPEDFPLPYAFNSSLVLIITDLIPNILFFFPTPEGRSVDSFILRPYTAKLASSYEPPLLPQMLRGQFGSASGGS